MATIRDVARASRVSAATVSRVFNNFPRVSETTRRRVVAAAGRLGYWPNGTARSLITSRTHALGVLLPDLHGEFFSELIRGIDSAARTHNLHLLVSSFRADPEDMTSALRAVRGRVDGLVVMAPDLDANHPSLAGAWTIPTVFLNPEVEMSGVDSISLANVEGAFAIVSHLLRTGHRRIATVTGPERNIDARQRLEGYREALRRAGLEPSEDLEIAGRFSEASGYEAGRALLGLEPRPTAVFAANDHMAIGVMGAMQDAGLRVPGDVAVAGFDDIPMARYLTPPLTTVHVDVLRLGQRAVELLLHPREDSATPGRHEMLTTTLVVRGSCGAQPPLSEGPGVRWERRHVVSAGSRRAGDA
jgi:LacI family transcriptional regulator